MAFSPQPVGKEKGRVTEVKTDSDVVSWAWDWGVVPKSVRTR